MSVAYVLHRCIDLYVTSYHFIVYRHAQYLPHAISANPDISLFGHKSGLGNAKAAQTTSLQFEDLIDSLRTRRHRTEECL